VGTLAGRFETVLRAADLPEDAALGLQIPNGAAFLGALLAARRAGHPVALLDASSRSSERQRVAEHLSLAAVMRVSERREPDPSELIVDRFALESTAPQLGSSAAVIKLTSGSTGQPRGVVVSTEALLADDEALRGTMEIGQGDRLLAMVPLSHSYGLSSLVVPALVAGLPLVVAPTADPFGPLRAAARWEATVFPTVPAYLTALLRLGEPPPLPPSLRRVIVAGAPLLPEIACRFRARTGRAAHVFYGASECGGITYDREGAAAERGTVGEAVEGVAIELQPVAGFAPAEAGRLVVSSSAVASGYWPEPHPDLAAGRFATGDLARLDGREVALLGRLDDLINVRGRKVSPREVEGVIAALPGVEDVVVRGVAENSSGREGIRAFVACAAGALDAERVVRWCRERLAEHKVPRNVVLVRELPRTARGKLDLAALPSAPGEVGAAAGQPAP
jgi:long-chain acyl-CoA synthetase